MHIDSGNMILFKEAQELQIVKTPEEFTERELTRALRDAIIAEENAIKQYEVVVDATDNEDVKKVLQDIANEEKVHVGELQKLLDDLLPDEKEFLEEGANEVEEEIVKEASENKEKKSESPLDLGEMDQEIIEFFKENPNPPDEGEGSVHQWAESKGYDVHDVEEAIYKLMTTFAKFLFEGRAKEKGLTKAKVDPKELDMGIEIELEHTEDEETAERIALDHLAEIPDYYTRLKKMEEKAGIEE
jgi:rubrerythrin